MTEPLECEARQSRAGHDQMRGIEPMGEQRARPDRQQDRDRRAERHHLLGPLMVVAQVVVEERDVVVREARTRART